MITKPNQDGPAGALVHAPWRASAALWKLQVHGLAGLTFLSFFPSLFHFQEYVFVFLFAVVLCLAWVERINPCIGTPFDVTLFGFVVFVFF